MLRFTILGCGSSGGVPLIGCECAVCSSLHPRNKRLRSSLLVESESTRIWIDASPDMRTQALRYRIKHIDGLIFTHLHADHTHGIDDVKAFNYHKQGAIDCYGDADTIASMRERFSYSEAVENAQYYGYKPALKYHAIGQTGEHKLGDICYETFLQLHGKMPTLGLRFGNIAYSTDVNNLPEESLQALESLDIWIVDCLQYQPAPTHAHLEMTLGWIERLKPRLAILTHMSHALEYESLRRRVPPHVVPAYDGLMIQSDTQGVFSIGSRV